MRTQPGDLPSSTLPAVLRAGWSLEAAHLSYRPVGFGSHHWELVTTTDERYFVTVDDLRMRRTGPADSLIEAGDRLRASLSAAQALERAGYQFVVAPVPGQDGALLRRLGEHYALAVYPFVIGESFAWGAYSPEHRRAVLELLIDVHAAPTSVVELARPDDFVIPLRDTVIGAVDGNVPVDPRRGPYVGPAAALLRRHATAVRRALARYDSLVAKARAEPVAAVLTHGEPHPGNTMRRNGAWLLIDWDTALAAPPERDLWDLDPGDGSIHAAYAEATGRAMRPDLLELYRLRWDLSDVASATAWLQQPHAGTADDEENWAILEEVVPRLG